MKIFSAFCWFIPIAEGSLFSDTSLEFESTVIRKSSQLYEVNDENIYAKNPNNTTKGEIFAARIGNELDALLGLLRDGVIHKRSGQDYLNYYQDYRTQVNCGQCGTCGNCGNVTHCNNNIPNSSCSPGHPGSPGKTMQYLFSFSLKTYSRNIIF